MGANSRTNRAATAANNLNTGISTASNALPQINATGAAAGTRSAGDYANANNQYTNANSTLGNAQNLVNSASAPDAALAANGGFTPEQQTNYLDRATSGVGSVYSGLQDNANRLMARTGASSGPAALAQIARQGGNAQSTALENANADLNQQINANKLAGSAGLNTLAGTTTNIGGGQASIGNDQANLYNTNEGVQTNANQQVINSANAQIGGGNAQGQNAANFGANALATYLPNVSVGPKGFSFQNGSGSQG